MLQFYAVSPNLILGSEFVKMNKKKDQNYLDYIPRRNPEYTWEQNKKNHAVIHVINKGLYNKLAQKVFHKPEVSHIELDDFGSYIWEQIDGSTTIYTISQRVKERFGEKAEPLYDRLVKYFEILLHNKFVMYKGKESK